MRTRYIATGALLLALLGACAKPGTAVTTTAAAPASPTPTASACNDAVIEATIHEPLKGKTYQVPDQHHKFQVDVTAACLHGYAVYVAQSCSDTPADDMGYALDNNAKPVLESDGRKTVKLSIDNGGDDQQICKLAFFGANGPGEKDLQSLTGGGTQLFQLEEYAGESDEFQQGPSFVLKQKA